METTSQELLKLEKKGFSASSIESTLSICKNKDSRSQRKRQHLSGKPLTSSVPTSQVLGKVKDFLGVLSEANNKLQVDAKDNPESYDIEVLDGNESEIIEMDLMLGIADLHTPEAVAAAESAAASCYPPIPLASSTGETDSEDTTDDDDNKNDNENSDDDHGICQAGVPTKHPRSESGEDDPCGGIGNKQLKKKPKKRTKIIEL
ncbi:uncharacterized protein LOC115690328 [Syzygium oleosum]|uniref:uncharacterized protein LOC115690328 n=1 Tax=Syzygium oleosum TaxID=219896 RepID=UPI0011D1B66B|nr:uncharacterized protein LOC115690328 [Syzygium oleosum]XP_056160691.1 uncharacterized protein LOC115690328 [Syzygium oleosum]XP_056160692.1 uncharacterized protein LOC115690328 [Syzygium oleosum]